MKAGWASAYILTAGLGLGFAYFVSTSLMEPARAQAPSDGSLPPEFMQEIEKGNSNPPSTPPSGGAAKPPPPPSNAMPPASPPPPSAAPPPAPSAEAMAHPPAGTAMSSEEYVYDPTGRRDPFRPYRVIRTESVKTATPSVSPETLLEPLQRYDLDQLSVMGILWDVRQPRALVRDSEGKIHTIVKNSKIGRNSGYVAAIREGEVVVIESIDDESGKVLKRTRVLEFKK